MRKCEPAWAAALVASVALPVFGHVVEFTFNPLWVQLDRIAHAEFGIERLYLVSGGRHLAIGSFLGPDEKASFANALNAALAAARRGVSYNPVASG